jgi:hypothetical protein
MICNLLLIRGTDILFVETPEIELEIDSPCEAIEETPLMANLVARGRTHGMLLINYRIPPLTF